MSKVNSKFFALGKMLNFYKSYFKSYSVTDCKGTLQYLICLCLFISSANIRTKYTFGSVIIVCFVTYTQMHLKKTRKIKGICKQNFFIHKLAVASKRF